MTINSFLYMYGFVIKEKDFDAICQKLQIETYDFHRYIQTKYPSSLIDNFRIPHDLEDEYDFDSYCGDEGKETKKNDDDEETDDEKEAKKNDVKYIVKLSVMSRVRLSLLLSMGRSL